MIYGYSKFLDRQNIYTINQKRISKKTLQTILNLDKQYYDADNCWELERLEKIYNKEKNSYILVKDKNKIIGYINILSIKKETYETIMNSLNLYDDLSEQDIVPYTKDRKKYYLTINSIVLKNEYQNKETLDKMAKAVQKFIKNQEHHGYHIEKLNAYTVNLLEEDVIQKLNFEKYKNMTLESFLYQSK